MKKAVIVSLAIAASVTLGGGAVAFAATQFASSPSTIEYSTPETEKSSSVEEKVEKVSEESASVSEPNTSTEATAPVAAPAPAAAPPAAPPAAAAAPPPASAPAPVSEDPMTRQWTDAAGNKYVGPNAVSCADGASPITPDFGLPAMCPVQLF